MRRKTITLLLVALSSATAHGQSSGGSFQIVSHVVAGGGGLSTDGSLSVDGTVNGTSAGSLLSNSPFSLTGGFWPPLQILAPFCVPGDGSKVQVGSTVRCFYFAEGTNVRFNEWTTDGFAPKSSATLNKTFHTEEPGPAAITVTWFDDNGGHIEMFHFTIERRQKRQEENREEKDAPFK